MESVLPSVALLDLVKDNQDMSRWTLIDGGGGVVSRCWEEDDGETHTGEGRVTNGGGRKRLAMLMLGGPL